MTKVCQSCVTTVVTNKCVGNSQTVTGTTVHAVGLNADFRRQDQADLPVETLLQPFLHPVHPAISHSSTRESHMIHVQNMVLGMEVGSRNHGAHWRLMKMV